MRLNFTTFFLLSLFALPARAETPPPPEATVRQLYVWVLAHPSRGLPSARERIRLAKILSPALTQLLQDASTTETRCVKAAPRGEKPDLIEGDLFVGNYEGATEVAYGPASRTGDIASLETRLVYVDTRFPKAHPHRTVAWTDLIELRFEGGYWLVRDIKREGKGALSAELTDYIADGVRSCPAT